MALRFYLRTKVSISKLVEVSLRKKSTSCGQNGNTSVMSAWQIDGYGGNDKLQMVKKRVPTITKPNQILIKVHASSINPIDVRMREGYGAAVLSPARKVIGLDDLPLVLGRDCSGIAVETGRNVKSVKKGDEVWAAVSQIKPGTHAQYVLVDESEIGIKPSNLTHIEAASIPYVAVTAWNALVTMAGLNQENATGKQVLIHAGAGGIGCLSIQMLRSWGAEVATTCSTDGVQLVSSLGAHHVVDYKTQNAKRELRRIGGFDVILDSVGGQTEDYSIGLLKKTGNAKYISLQAPIAADTDSLGLLQGGLSAGWQMLQKAGKTMRFGNMFYWAFAIPNRQALDHVKNQVETDDIKPVIDKVFPFSDLAAAMNYVEKGGARGKTVVEMDSD